MLVSKSKRSLLPLTVLLTGLSLTSILQLSQTAHSQQDYEELIITGTGSEQELEEQELQYSYFSKWGSSGTDNGQF